MCTVSIRLLIVCQYMPLNHWNTFSALTALATMLVSIKISGAYHSNKHASW